MYIVDENGTLLNGFEAFHRLTLEVNRNPKDEYVRARDAMFNVFANMDPVSQYKLYLLCNEIEPPVTYKEEGFDDLCNKFAPLMESRLRDLIDRGIEPEVENPLSTSFVGPANPSGQTSVDELTAYEMLLPNALYYKDSVLYSGFQMFHQLVLNASEHPESVNNARVISSILDIYDNADAGLKEDLYLSCQTVDVPSTSREMGFAELCSHFVPKQEVSELFDPNQVCSVESEFING
jgi:hypothetical protein